MNAQRIRAARPEPTGPAESHNWRNRLHARSPSRLTRAVPRPAKPARARESTSAASGDRDPGDRRRDRPASQTAAGVRRARPERRLPGRGARPRPDARRARPAGPPHDRRGRDARARRPRARRVAAHGDGRVRHWTGPHHRRRLPAAA
ncbi:hypothetical protein E1287_36360, partial [Actinomadura sp. KC06]